MVLVFALTLDFTHFVFEYNFNNEKKKHRVVQSFNYNLYSPSGVTPNKRFSVETSTDASVTPVVHCTSLIDPVGK